MASRDQLPALLLLLDDDSAVVLEEVGRALQSFGSGLAGELDSLQPPVEGATREKIQRLVEPWARDRLILAWSEWQEETSFAQRLESGLDSIAAYQTGSLYQQALAELLGQLTDDSKASGPLEWARELFGQDGLSGNEQNYYHPRNSNLVHVLKTSRGNPISLTCIYILTALRLGWQVAGCNNPGHFLAQVTTEEGEVYVDCFAGGRVLSEREAQILEARLDSPTPSADSILSRVLRNLINGHRLLFQKSEMDLYYFLLKSLTFPSSTRPDSPNFSPGDLVQHKRYGYRGVVVDYDLRFSGEETWYRSNRTQPEKNQPWYNVLVDESDQITYTAQTSLEADSKEAQVLHPLIPVFFSNFQGGCYWRNGRRWIVDSAPTKPAAGQLRADQ
jgi:hemimethylated DNA binding protein